MVAESWYNRGVTEVWLVDGWFPGTAPPLMVELDDQSGVDLE